MEFASYLEVNISAIIILVIIKLTMRRYHLNLSSDRFMFQEILNLDIVFSITNILSRTFLGKPGTFNRVLLAVSDMINVESVTMISFCWLLYVFARAEIILSRRKRLLWSLPLIVVSILLLANPFTGWIFSIDEMNVYHREAGIYLHWAVSWIYAVIGTSYVLFRLAKAKTERERRTFRPLLWFIFFPCAAGAIQMMVYGISATQMGLTVGVLITFIICTCDDISMDGMTGLNNRDGMERYLQTIIEGGKENDMTIMMIDLNDFKRINDSKGHGMGDVAIKEAASIIKRVCGSASVHVSIFRYGGDEFVIIGKSITRAWMEKIAQEIRKESENRTAKQNNQYKLSFSMGIAQRVCRTLEDVEELLAEADQAMYCEKKLLKDENVKTVSSKRTRKFGMK